MRTVSNCSASSACTVTTMMPEGLLVQILAEGFSQNDYAAAKALRDHGIARHWDSHDLQFLSFLAERLNPIRGNGLDG